MAAPYLGIKSESYKDRYLNESTIKFSDAISALREASPAFRKFEQALPQEIEIQGYANGKLVDSRKVPGEAGRVHLNYLYLNFKLRGYSESNQ